MLDLRVEKVVDRIYAEMPLLQARKTQLHEEVNTLRLAQITMSEHPAPVYVDQSINQYEIISISGNST